MTSPASHFTPEIEAWAKARWADVQAREGLYGLRIGPGKPMGSQGFPQEERGQLRGLSRGRLLDHLRLQGYGVPEVVPEEECSHFWSQSAGSIWLYLWHVPSMLALLEKNEEVLATSGWERATNESCRVFATLCKERPVRPLTALFDVIADAYGDKTGPGRTDVLPGVPYVERLAAFKRVNGFEDMTAVYARLTGLL